MGHSMHNLPTTDSCRCVKTAEFQHSHLGDGRQIPKSASSPGSILSDGRNRAKVPHMRMRLGNIMWTALSNAAGRVVAGQSETTVRFVSLQAHA